MAGLYPWRAHIRCVVNERDGMFLQKRILCTLMLCVGVLLAGCAGAPYMPLHEETEAVDTAAPLYLMTVSIKNVYKPRWQPKVLNVILVKPGAAPESRAFGFRMDDQGEVEAQDDSGVSTFLVRFKTDASPHVLDGSVAMARAFPVIGTYTLNLQLPIPPKSSGVHYLGAINAVVRERLDSEFRAGPVIPLIDQAVAGASSGTFDVVVADQYEQDMALFAQRFPALKDAKVQKALLPPWDRAKIQAAWEKN